MKVIKVAATLVLVLILNACTSSKIYNINGALIAYNQSKSDTSRLITKALVRKRWKMRSDTGNEIIATILVRETLSATIKITYDSAKYSITHLESANLNYDESNQTIHRNYNKWIALLNKEILFYFAHPIEADARARK